ncbi:MAG TPA: peptidoglycan bridge formation glycyltransferase FemA/FemB family protein [Patescibacteria group bacterium]|nr:peptidoglycan bridge formation glycyltransferase FemA/FemB family protein [Patescibacteria group bacterium]
MKLIYIDESRRDEWEHLTKTNPASGYMQSFWWTEFKNLLGWQSYKIGIVEKDKLVGGTIISKYAHYKGRNTIEITEGPVLPYNNPEKAETMFHMLISEIDTVADLTGENRTSHLSIEPKLTSIPAYFSRFRKAPVDQLPLRTLLIDLHKSDNELLREMKPKCRYNIKVATKNDVRITKTTLPDGINDFLRLYTPFVKRTGFDGKDEDYFLCLADLLVRETDAVIYFAVLGNEILGTAMVLYYGHVATFLYGASSEKKKNMMAPYLLHWEIIRDAKKRGLAWYDFYGLAPGEDTETHPWQGFSVFKRKFGGVEVNYIGGYDFVYNEALYKRHLLEDR